MKTLLISILLFSLSLFAQDDVVYSPRGSGQYLYTAQTDSFDISNDNILFYGTTPRTLSDTGTTFSLKYMNFKYDGGTYDSTQPAINFSNGIITISSMVDDTSGDYYTSVYYKTKNNYWIYDAGDVEVFTTPLRPPIGVQAFVTENYEVNLFWTKVATQNVGYTQVWRKYNHVDSAYSKIDSVSIATTSYTDAGLPHSAQYQYKVRHRGNSYSEFAESNIITVTIPDYQFTLVPAFINITVDSTTTDTTFTILAVNASGGSITLNDITGEALPFTVTPEAALPEAVANSDTLSIDVTLYRDTSGTFSQTLTFDLVTYNDQTIQIYAVVTQPPPADTTAPDPIDAILATGYNVDGIPKTFIKVDLTLGTMSADADSIYWYRSNVNSLTTFTEWQRTALNIITSNDTIPEADQYRKYYVRIKDDNGNLSWVNPSDSGLVPSASIPPPPFSGNRWYAGNTSSGSNNGTSWANKWASSGIGWTSVQAGDIIYLDGGTDSVVYASNRFITVGKSGTAALPITITVGAYAPDNTLHSGRVIFDGGGGTGTAFQIRATGAGRNYVTIEGMYNGTRLIECRNLGRGANLEDVTNGIIISGLDITNYSGQGAVMLNGASEYTVDSTIIRNCRMISVTLSASQSDGIYAQRSGNILSHDNFIRQRNQDPAAHTDALQGYLTNGWVVYNNTFINDSVYSPEGGGTPMIFGIQGTRNTLVYNNFLYMGGIWYPTGSQNSCFWSRLYPANDSGIRAWVVHNTFVVNGTRCRGMIQEYKTTSVNNIIAMYSTSSQMAALEESVSGTPSSIYVDSTRNNLFYKTSGSSYFAGSFIGSGGSPTGSPTSTTWLTTYGGTGQFVNPRLVKSIGYVSDQGSLVPDLQSNSPAINAGNNVEDIEAYIDWLNAQGFDGTNAHTGEWMLPKTDFYGNDRVGNWDVGAFEYQP